MVTLITQANNCFIVCLFSVLVHFILSAGYFRSLIVKIYSQRTKAQERSQVVAIGTALPTAAPPVETHHGLVMVGLQRGWSRGVTNLLFLFFYIQF